jgi:hypothetical protein
MNTKYPTLRSVAALAVAVLSLNACTKTVVTGSFNRVPNTAVEYAYINEQVDFSQYTKLMNDLLPGRRRAARSCGNQPNSRVLPRCIHERDRR